MDEKKVNFLKDYEETNIPIKELCKKYQMSDRFLYYAIKNNLVENRKDKHSYCYNQLLNNQELFFYLLGLISADGCLEKNHRIEILLHIKENEYLQNLSMALFGQNNVIVEEKRNRVRLFIYNKDVYELFQSYGLTQRKTATLKINFEKIPKDYFHHFLRGYIDGDGTYFIKNINNVHIKIDGNNFMMNGLKKYIELYYNLCSNIYLINRGQVSFDFYRWTISKTLDSKQLINILYNNAIYYLPRKYDIIKQILTCAV